MKRFIDEEIFVALENGAFLEKAPKCPVKFQWRDRWLTVQEIRSAWQDFSRKGDYSRNMKDKHLDRAQRIGSWGVGRFYFEIKADDDDLYTIYYDRAPENAHDRKGKWFLFTLELD